LANRVTVRSGSVEVRPTAGDFATALGKLRELSRAFNGVRLVEVTDAGGELIRVTPTESAIRDYEPSIVDQSIQNIPIRLFDVTATVEREGANRVRVRIPRLGPETISHVAW
jgi:hypothetical protein